MKRMENMGIAGKNVDCSGERPVKIYVTVIDQ